MNSICLIGNICNDLELKTTNNGKSVCSFNLAVKRPFAKDTTDFITIVCWNKQAENVCKYCYKGTKIGVSGMLTTRTYQDRDGNNRTVYEVLASEIEFLAKKAEGQSNATSTNYAPTNSSFPDEFEGFQVFNDDDCPF